MCLGRASWVAWVAWVSMVLYLKCGGFDEQGLGADI